MNTPLPTLPDKEKTAQYIYLSTLYFVAAGTLYLWGYWSNFHINILEYLAFTDILKQTAYPVMASMVIVTIAIVLAGFTGIHQDIPQGPPTPARPPKRILRGFAWAAVALLATGVGALYVSEWPVRWKVVPLAFGVPVAAYLADTKLLAAWIPRKNFRNTVSLLLACIPAYSFGEGHRYAEHVIFGTEYLFLAEGTEVAPPDLRASAARYVGHAGEEYFFWLPKTQRLSIRHLDKDKPFELVHYKAPEKPVDMFRSPR